MALKLHHKFRLDYQAVTRLFDHPIWMTPNWDIASQYPVWGRKLFEFPPILHRLESINNTRRKFLVWTTSSEEVDNWNIPGLKSIGVEDYQLVRNIMGNHEAETDRVTNPLFVVLLVSVPVRFAS